MSKTGYVKIALRLVTVARSCFLNLSPLWPFEGSHGAPLDPRPILVSLYV
jgi:hypothetical protein